MSLLDKVHTVKGSASTTDRNLVQMGKSIRSKSKRQFRAIKRNSIFGTVELERTVRLAGKQECSYRANEISTGDQEHKLSETVVRVGNKRKRNYKRMKPKSVKIF